MDDSMCGHSRGQGVRYDQEICGECSCSWAEPDCARDSGDAPPSPDVEETETHVGAGPVADAVGGVFQVVLRDLIADVTEQGSQDLLDEV